MSHRPLENNFRNCPSTAQSQGTVREIFSSMSCAVICDWTSTVVSLLRLRCSPRFLRRVVGVGLVGTAFVGSGDVGFGEPVGELLFDGGVVGVGGEVFPFEGIGFFVVELFAAVG